MFVVKWVVVLIIVVLIVAVIILSDPLRRSNEEIRKNILSDMPLGSHKDDVLEYISKNKRWTIGSGASHFGPIEYKTFARVHMGEYRTILITDAVAFWLFDENDELIELIVKKWIDGL